MKKFIIFLLILALIFPIISAQINDTNVSIQNNESNNPAFSYLAPLNQTAGTGFAIDGNQLVNIYYVIPIAMTLGMIIILIILIAIARLINLNKRKHRIKPITSIHSQEPTSGPSQD